MPLLILTNAKLHHLHNIQADQCQPEPVEGGRFMCHFFVTLKVLLYTVFKDLATAGVVARGLMYPLVHFGHSLLAGHSVRQRYP